MSDDDGDGSEAPESTHPDDLERPPGDGGPETALVVGAGTAVGRASALAFREEGWRVYAVGREEDDVADLAEYGCLVDGCDVTDERAVRRVVKRATTEAGRVDCLVAADVTARFGPVEETDVGSAEAMLDHNVLGPLRLFRRVLPHMREREDGTIVAVSSVLGRVAAPGTGLYSGSQFAVEAICDSLRAEVEDDGVNVVLVEPALLECDLDEPTYDPEETDYEWVYDLLADVRAVADGGPGVATPERVGAAVVNAASATMPAPRYPVGPAADVLSKTRYLPDDWRDLLYGVVRKTTHRG